MDVRNNDFPLRSEYTNTSSAGPAASGAGPSLGIMDILGTLRREWRFPLFGCLIGLALGVSYIVFVPTLYKSSARILLARIMHHEDHFCTSARRTRAAGRPDRTDVPQLTAQRVWG
jgi:hypothetical protein